MHALMATSKVKSSSKVPRKWMTTNFLPEALAVDLHVLEDENMIRSLGRDKFVQLSIHGSQGWQHGVFDGIDGISRIFRCTMKQNRKNCAAIYCEEEYEKLVLEAYWQARAKTKMANNRYPFFCIFCKESYKDKNTLSFHRMFNLCKGYTGQQPLKMYPTWEPSNHEEKVRILTKYENVSLPTASQSPSFAIFPPPLELDVLPVCSTTLATVPVEQRPTSRKRKLQNNVLPTETPFNSVSGRARNLVIDIAHLSPPRKAQNLGVKATEKISKSPPSSECGPKANKQPSRVIISSSAEDLNSASSHSEFESTTEEATLNSQKNGFGEFCVVKHDHVFCVQPSHEDVIHAQHLLELVQPRFLSREECKQQAHEEATILFNLHNVYNEIGSPPEPIPVNGLYILITETGEQWVSKDLLDDPDACMQYLHKQLEDGTIKQHIGNAFGQWYLYGNVQNTKTPGEESEFLEKIKTQVKCFKCNSNIQVYEELKNLKDYLQYCIQQREYDAKVAAVKASFEEFRRKHVEAELRKFDRAVKEKEEESKWNWSPLYQIFKKWPLKNFRDGPWDHTDKEWLEMSAILLDNTKSEPLSLELECPHILRAFLYLIRILEGYSRPLSHPTRGLDLQYILQLAHDTHHSVALRRVVQSLPLTGWCTFPSIQNASDNFDDLFSDIEALLGYESSRQMAVIEKIQSFIGRIAQRAIADMVRMHRKDELADMWFNEDITHERHAKCEEVLCSSLIFREDVDVGTTMLGDLYKKSHCVQLRVEEMVQVLQHVRSTQLRLFNCGLGVEETTDDIAQDVHCTRMLLGDDIK